MTIGITLLKFGIMSSPYIFRQSYPIRIGIMLKLYQDLGTIDVYSDLAPGSTAVSPITGSVPVSSTDSVDSFEGSTRRSESGAVSSSSDTSSRGEAASAS